MPAPMTQTINWDDIVTSTMEDRSGELKDNVTNNNALLMAIKRNGNVRPFMGGREIIEELEYAQNQTFEWFSGFETLNVALSDTMTAARFPIKQAKIAVVISGLEKIQNSGRAQKVDLLRARIGNAENTFWNQMSAGIYSDGTGFGGRQIGGTALIISKTPTSGIVGGIDRATNPWWQNFSIDQTVDSLGAITAANIKQYMNKLSVSIKRGTDGIDMIVMDNVHYLFYLSSLQDIQRISDEGKGGHAVGAGFTSLKYYGAGKSVDVILDGGKNGQIPPNTSYFINSKFFHYRPAAELDFKPMGGERTNVNQDATIRLWGWAGNITVSNSSLQGVLF